MKAHQTPRKGTDLGASRLEVEECDNIALTQNSIVGILKPQDGLMVEGVDNLTCGDWAFRWISVHADGRGGKLIISPTNHRTKRLVTVGRAFYLARQCALSPGMALSIIQSTWSVQHAHEPSVLRLVGTSFHTSLWDDYPGEPDKEWIKQARKEWGHLYGELNRLPPAKIHAAGMIVNNLYDDSYSKPYIRNPWHEWELAEQYERINHRPQRAC